MTGPAASRLAFPDRRRKEPIDALCAGGRVPLLVQPPDEALRPRGGHRGPDARRPGRAVLLRDRLSFQGTSTDELERAATGRIGSPIAQLLLLCYDYDAATGKYTLSIVRLIRVFGTLTALSLGVFLFVMFRRERRGRPGTSPAPSDAATTAAPGPGL